MGTAQQTSPVVTVTRLAARLHRVWLALVLCVVLLGIGLRSGVTAAAAQGPIVYVIPIDRTIHLGVAPFVQRTLDEAASAPFQPVR